MPSQASAKPAQVYFTPTEAEVQKAEGEKEKWWGRGEYKLRMSRGSCPLNYLCEHTHQKALET